MSKIMSMDNSIKLKTNPIHDEQRKTFLGRLWFYLNPADGRYEDLKKGPLHLNILRDFTAGLIVAMVAIPLAMGLAMASGLPPEMGIVGGAVAGLVGALFGGSKYQVYGPTAAFIPVIAGITAKYQGYDFLITCSLLSGLILIAMGLVRAGRIVALVPHSIVVGFTIGIAFVIALSQIEQILGFKAKIGYGFFAKLQGIWAYKEQFNVFALVLALVTFGVTKGLLKLSKYVPAPLIAVAIATGIASTVWADQGLILVRDKYGAIPTSLLRITFPKLIELNASTLWDLAYYTTAIVFVSGVESLLCSRMADRLGDNKGIPYNPNKELWGQGWVQIVIPLINGFPHTGALARTATNIKVGAISPLAGIFKFALKLLLAVFLAKLLERVPMACIGGILLYVAVNMVKAEEVREVWKHNRFHSALMVYTAVMVAITDFLVGVVSALVLYAGLRKFLDKPAASAPKKAMSEGESGGPAENVEAQAAKGTAG